MEFQVRTVYTEETVVALVAVNRVRQKRPLWARVINILMGVLFVLAGGGMMAVQVWWMFSDIFTRTSRDWSVMTLIGAALMLGIGIGQLRPKQQDRLTAKDIWKSYRDKDMETIFRFTPEGFWYRTPVSECSYDYAVLSDFWTDGAYYFLFLSSTKRDAYVLRYADFTQGDPAAFGAMLEKWTGKEVRAVR